MKGCLACKVASLLGRVFSAWSSSFHGLSQVPQVGGDPEGEARPRFFLGFTPKCDADSKLSRTDFRRRRITEYRSQNYTFTDMFLRIIAYHKESVWQNGLS